MKKFKKPFFISLLMLTFTATQCIQTNQIGYAASSSNPPAGNQSPTAAIPAWIEQLAKQTGLQWYDIAAIHQYEYNIHNKKNFPESHSHISIPNAWWSGILNPNQEETNPALIRLFGGMGQDGSGDGQAQRLNRSDAANSFFSFLAKQGTSERNLEHTLNQFYGNESIIKRIHEYQAIYKNFGTTTLKDYVFPISIRRDYSYRDTWGDGRSWGGRRIHEGTDIFAPYGTPVLSVTYGYIESIGWNKYGGWRVGIRTVDNLYFYYAHLSGYAKGIKQGKVVKPGEVIGYVGSSGYGKIGTSGKFPPHLHFGMYRDTGKSEWAFDPYPNLKRWEQALRKRN